MEPEIREVFAALQAYLAAVRQCSTAKVPRRYRLGRRQCTMPGSRRPQGAPDSAGWPGAPTWERAAHKLGAAIHCSSSFVVYKAAFPHL